MEDSSYYLSSTISIFQDQRERRASKSQMDEEPAKPVEMDKTPKKNPFVPLQVSQFSFFSELNLKQSCSYIIAWCLQRLENLEK